MSVKNRFEYKLHVPRDMNLRKAISVFSNISYVKFTRILQFDDTLHLYISIEKQSYVKDHMNHFEVKLPILVSEVNTMIIHSFRDVCVRIVDNKYPDPEDIYKYLLSIYATQYTFILDKEIDRTLRNERRRERDYDRDRSRSRSRERDYDRYRDRSRSRSRGNRRDYERSTRLADELQRKSSTRPPPPSTPPPTKAPMVQHVVPAYHLQPMIMPHAMPHMVQHPYPQMIPYHPQPMIPNYHDHPHPDPQMRYAPYYPPYEDMRKY